MPSFIGGTAISAPAALAAAAWALAERYEKGADLTSATRWARKAAKYASGDERRIRKVMQLLDRAGDRAGALGDIDSAVLGRS